MKCPGQDTRYWKRDAVFETTCPECGGEIEFFKDDTVRKCGGCGLRLTNPRMDFGCASYCRFAEQCLGSLTPEFLAKRKEMLKERVAVEVKRYFKTDFKRIGHASRVAMYAERIGRAEKGSDAAVVLIAAYLHDIGIPEAERKHGSSAPKWQHLEGPPVARGMLEELGAPEDLIEEVTDIVGHHHWPRDEETLNFKVLYDADMIVNLEEKHREKPFERERIERIINKSLFTEAGKREALKSLGV